MITFVIEQEELYESRGSRTVLWERSGEIPLRDSIITDKLEDRTIHFTVTVIPDEEATYPGGSKDLRLFIKKNTIDKISEKSSTQTQQGKVKFTVNEAGKVSDVQLSQSSGDHKIDKLLLETINKMPKWIPARDFNGVNVKQVFQLTVGGSDGC